MTYLKDIQIIQGSFTDSYSKDWLIFLRDNLKNIREHSSVTNLDQNKLRRMKYRPELILEDYPSYSITYLYVLLLVNYLASPNEFYNIESIYVPSIRYIESLEREYQLQKTASTIKKVTKT
jgi:hypothetical protein